MSIEPVFFKKGNEKGSAIVICLAPEELIKVVGHCQLCGNER